MIIHHRVGRLLHLAYMHPVRALEICLDLTKHIRGQDREWLGMQFDLYQFDIVLIMNVTSSTAVIKRSWQ